MFPLVKEGWVTLPPPNGHCAEPSTGSAPGRMGQSTAGWAGIWPSSAWTLKWRARLLMSPCLGRGLRAGEASRAVCMEWLQS